MPTETSEVYECEICGAVVEVKEGGAGTLECCGQPMTIKEQLRYLLNLKSTILLRIMKVKI